MMRGLPSQPIDRNIGAWAAGRHPEERAHDWIYAVAEVLVACALSSLFLPLRLELAFTQVRPFDLFSILLFGVALARLKRLPAPAFWSGLIIVMPYLAWHVISAFTYTTSSGLRETLQIGVVVMFACSVYAVLPVLRFRRIAWLLLFGMTVITAYNVYYHVSMGQWFGWKTLGSSSTGDIKYTFQFLPPVVGLLMLFDRNRAYFYRAAWLVLGVVIVCSGERKALLAYGLISVALATRARLKLAVPALAALVVVGAFISSRIDDGYMSIQLNSITNYSDVDQDRFDMIVRGAGPKSLSDSQRIFAFHVGRGMLEDRWLFGVGTNAYQDRVMQEFSYAPSYVLLGIHGEFWRVLVENGVVGWVLYVSIWLAAVFRLIKTLTWLNRAGAIEPHAVRLIFLLILLPVGFSVAFEAAGTHAFVALLVASFAPELVYYALRGRLGLSRSASGSRTKQRGAFALAFAPELASFERPSTRR